MSIESPAHDGEGELDPALHEAIARVRERRAADPPVELLVAAPFQVLPPALQDAASEHLAQSAWSRAVVEGFDDEEPEVTAEDEDRLWRRIQVAAGHAGDEAAPAAPERGRWRGWWWAPALAAATAGAVVALWSGGPTVTPSAPPAATSAATVAAATPPPATPWLPLDHPAVRLGPGALTWRGTGQASDLLGDLKPALDAVRSRDYAEASRLLTPLEKRYPASTEVWFYQGVARLHIGDAAGALAAFEQAASLKDPTFTDDIAWYTALAEQRTGAGERAMARLRSICESAAPRSGAACAAVRSGGGSRAR
jgi:hypothetical protein